MTFNIISNIIVILLIYMSFHIVHIFLQKLYHKERQRVYSLHGHCHKDKK